MYSLQDFFEAAIYFTYPQSNRVPNGRSTCYGLDDRACFSTLWAGLLGR